MARALWVSIAMLLFASGCGDDGVATGSVEVFCVDWTRAETVIAESDFDQDLQQSMRRLRDALAEMTYPSELTDDADQLLEGIDHLIDELDEHGGDPLNLSPKEREAMDKLTLEYEASSNRISDFAESNC